MLYNIFSFACIAAMFIMVAAYAFAFYKQNRQGKIDLIKRFKKGSCVLIYLFAIPLYTLGHLYAGTAPLLAFFTSIKKSLALVVFDYDTDSIAALMADSLPYSLAIYVCFFFTLSNAVLFIFSFLHQKIWEFAQKMGWRYSKRERLLIVGYNDKSIKIYASDRTRRKIILDNLPEDVKSNLYLQNVSFISKTALPDKKTGKETEIEAFCGNVFTQALRTGEKCLLVINTESDETNISLCQCLIAKAGSVLAEKSEEYVADALKRVKIYVLGSPLYETVYNTLAETSHGCVRYVDKYRQIAMDFIDRYPLTQFMTGKHIDYERALLRSEVNVNVAMIGFGNTNLQIFLTSIANNQFMAEENGHL